MSWEAFRLTSKSPSELYDVIGPEGVDHLVRQFLTACWNALPPGTRTLAAWQKLAAETFDRNMKVWRSIKKPNPAAFFADLHPEPADGHLRQAMVMSWMMLPRKGGRKFSDTHKIITRIYERNLAAWQGDHATFTGKKPPRAQKARTSGSAGRKRRKSQR